MEYLTLIIRGPPYHLTTLIGPLSLIKNNLISWVAKAKRSFLARQKPHRYSLYLNSKRTIQNEKAKQHVDEETQSSGYCE